MKRYFRTNGWMDGRYLIALGIWPIPEYCGLGFSICFLWYEAAAYFNPRGWPDEAEERARQIAEIEERLKG